MSDEWNDLIDRCMCMDTEEKWKVDCKGHVAPARNTFQQTKIHKNNTNRNKSNIPDKMQSVSAQLYMSHRKHTALS